MSPRRSVIGVALTLALAGLGLGFTAAHAGAGPAAAAVPRFDHVVVAVMENKGYSQIIGNSSAPYINSLAAGGALFTNSHGVTHPSQPNYIAMLSGSTQGVIDDSCPRNFTGKANLASQLIDAGRSFVGFSEDQPSVGYTGCTSGGYARKHNPWVDFDNVPAASNQPYTAFPTDYATLPTVAYVVPNLCNDMHDCSVSTGDTWLKDHLDGYVQWARTHNSLFVLTWDEDNFTLPNKIPTIFAGAGVKTGNYGENVNHYHVLRTFEDMYGLAPLGGAATATPITDVWAPSGTVTVTNPGTQTSTVGTPATLQIQATTSSPSATLTYAAAGLPPGLSVNSASGLISGTPTTAGSYAVTISATDSTGASASASFTWNVTGGSGGCTAAQLLGNPGFETGSAAPWTASAGVVTNAASQAAHSGSWKALLGGHGTTRTDTLSQQVSVPAGCTTYSLSFWLHIDTAETTTRTAYDKLTAKVGAATLATYSNLDKATGYTQKTFDLSAYAGQTVTISFTGTEDVSLQTSFVIDDTAVQVS